MYLNHSDERDAEPSNHILVENHFNHHAGKYDITSPNIKFYPQQMLVPLDFLFFEKSKDGNT